MSSPSPAPKAKSPDWLALQKKIFSRWVGQRVSPAGLKVNDLVADMKDGILMITLLEALSGIEYKDKAKIKPAKIRIQQIDNVSKALEFVKQNGVNVQASAENIVDGDEKMCMALIFSIIVKFLKVESEDEQAVDVKEAIMLWYKNKTAGYQNVKIENLTKSFHDGLAFCALIHRMRPNLIDYNSLTPEDKIKNISTALDIAHKFGIVEKYVEPTDIQKMDELTMVVYLSDWYFGVSMLQKQDIAARRIGRVVVMTQTHDQMKADYNASAKLLVDWMNATIGKLGDRTFDNTLEGVENLLKSFYDYKTKEKGDKLTQRMDVEALYNNLALRLQNNNRPAYNPPAGLALNDILAKFDELETAENERSVALHTELSRQKRLDKMAKRFAADASKLEEWIGEKEKYLAAKEEIDSVAKAQLHIKLLDAYNKEQENIKATRYASLSSLAAEIVGDNYQHSKDITSRQQTIEAKFGTLTTAAGKKAQVLDEDLKREQHKEKLRLDFAQLANDFQRWTSDKIDECLDVYFGENIEAVEAYEEVLKKSEADIVAKAQEKKAAYHAVGEEMKKYGVKDNHYTNLSLDDLEALGGKLQVELENRKVAYQAEIDKLLNAMKKDHEDKAQKLVEWANSTVTSLNDRTFDNTLEGAKAKVKEFEEYKLKVKSEKVTIKNDLEALFVNLTERLAKHKRPGYSPSGLQPGDINGKFAEVDAAENSRNAALNAELARQLKLEKLSKRFAADSKRMEFWISEKEQYLGTKEDIDSVAKAQLHIKLLEAYNLEQDNIKNTRFAELKSLADEIINDNYIKKDEIAATQNGLDGRFANLSTLSAAKGTRLDEDLKREQHKDKLRLDFAQVANEFNRWAADQVESLGNTYFGDTLETVESFADTLTKSESDISARANDSKVQWDKVAAELKEYNVTDNEYSLLTVADLETAKSKVESEVTARRKAYEAELQRQRANDALCKKFAAEAKAFNTWLEEQKVALQANKTTPLEDQLKEVVASLEDNKEGDAKLKSVEDLDRQSQEAGITNNKYTSFTVNDAKTSYQQYQILLRKKKVLLESELENSKKSGLSDQQLQEIRDNFKYYDKDSSGQLDKREFRACLQSLGEEVSPTDVQEALDKYDTDKDGTISFDEFVDFMVVRLGDTNTKEEILDGFKLINGKEYAIEEFLRAVVNNLTFKDEYVEYLLKEMTPVEGGYNYVKWTEEVFAR